MYGIPKTLLGGVVTKDRTNCPGDSAWRYWKVRIPAMKWGWAGRRVGEYRAFEYTSAYESLWTGGYPDKGYNSLVTPGSGEDGTVFQLGSTRKPGWVSDYFRRYPHAVNFTWVDLRESWGGPNLFEDSRVEIECSTDPQIFDFMRAVNTEGWAIPAAKYRISPARNVNFTLDFRKRTRIRMFGLYSTFLWSGIEVFASNDKTSWVKVLEKSPQEFREDFRWVNGYLPQPWCYDLITGLPGYAPVDATGYRYWAMAVESLFVPRVNPYDYDTVPVTDVTLRFSETESNISNCPGYVLMKRFVQSYEQNGIGTYGYGNGLPGHIALMGRGDLLYLSDPYSELRPMLAPGVFLAYDYGEKKLFTKVIACSGKLTETTFSILASNDAVRWREIKHFDKTFLTRRFLSLEA